MWPLRARVINGRLVLYEPTTLPDGTEIELAPVEDDLDDDPDRARLHEALDAADDELCAGKWIAGTQLVATLRRRAATCKSYLQIRQESAARSREWDQQGEVPPTQLSQQRRDNHGSGNTSANCTIRRRFFSPNPRP